MEKELAGIIIILSFVFIGYILYLMLVAASDEDDLRDELMEKEEKND